MTKIFNCMTFNSRSFRRLRYTETLKILNMLIILVYVQIINQIYCGKKMWVCKSIWLVLFIQLMKYLPAPARQLQLLPNLIKNNYWTLEKTFFG